MRYWAKRIINNEDDGSIVKHKLQDGRALKGIVTQSITVDEAEVSQGSIRRIYTLTGIGSQFLFIILILTAII
jgi:hypothetical protein